MLISVSVAAISTLIVSSLIKMTEKRSKVYYKSMKSVSPMSIDKGESVDISALIESSNYVIDDVTIIESWTR